MEERGKHIETLLVIVLGMTGAYFLSRREEFLYAGAGIGVTGLAIPAAARFLHAGWMGLASVLGFIHSHIILGLVFFLILTPLAWLRRLSADDPLQRRKGLRKSHFVEREHLYEARDMENPW
jgi:CHASE2 domain-containing sensor protein